MFVLSRKKEQSVVINDNIVVTVVAVCRDKVRLGFTADRSVKIDRMEVRLAQEAESHLLEPSQAVA